MKIREFIKLTEKSLMNRFLLHALVQILSLSLTQSLFGQQMTGMEALWQPDRGDGTYKNPVICADYSDPDVIRTGADFYMVSSSFSHFPGLPVLKSNDLVNWELIAHAAEHYPAGEFIYPQHGCGIWAPSIRFHGGYYYIFFGDPDRGVFMTKARDPCGPWEELKLIKKVTGWIDCCPLWDDDGQAYLVHAFANSRSGIKSLLFVNRMNPDGTEIFDGGILVFNGQDHHPTIEGPKFYKRNGYYYIFAPAGGVKTGWQTVLRSESVFGPYEDRIVLRQGNTDINGPHQGAWVGDSSGCDWFIHFQDRYVYGRVIHLQPVNWVDDWPVIGNDSDGDGTGEPVEVFRKPYSTASAAIKVPQTSDDFSDPDHSGSLSLQWQWEAEYSPDWFSLTARPGFLRLYPVVYASGHKNLWDEAALLLQKFPSENFTAAVKLEASFKHSGERSGLLVFGTDYAAIFLEKTTDGLLLKQVVCQNADRGTPELTVWSSGCTSGHIWLKANISNLELKGDIPVANCAFYYSTDGVNYISTGVNFIAREGKWVGAKTGIFSSAIKAGKDVGYTDFDWFNFYPLMNSY